MSTQTSPPQRAQFVVLQVICAAMLASLAVYVVIARVLVDRGELAAIPAPASLPAVLGGVALMLLLAAPPLASLLRRNAHGQETAEGRIAAHRVATVVAFAMREAAAILGLVATLLTGEWMWSVGFAAAAALAMLAGWPKRADFDTAVDPAGPRPIG